MNESQKIPHPTRLNIPGVVAAICTSAFSIMALLMWHGTLNSQADNVVTVLALSFISIIAGTLGVRRTGGRALSAVCLGISSLFFLCLMSVIVLVTLTLTKMGH